ncbi:MAG: host attachment protein [Alphaproteobacteria bacterium]|nr:host attachment protein [Alphaproteobacteria bacterium]
MNHQHTWILVADAGNARILQYEGPFKPLTQVDGALFAHKHEMNHEFVSSDRGRTAGRFAGSKHAFEWPTDPHQYEKKIFAKELTRFLGAHEQDFQRLILVAPPEMMGNIHHETKANHILTKKIYAKETKNLTRVPLHRMAQHLKGVLNFQLKAA